MTIERSQDLSSKRATSVSSQTSVPANRAVIEKDWQREDTQSFFSVCMCVWCMHESIHIDEGTCGTGEVGMRHGWV